MLEHDDVSASAAPFGVTERPPAEVAALPIAPAPDAGPSSILEAKPTTNTALQTDGIFRFWAQDFYDQSANRHYDAAIARMLHYLAPSRSEAILDAGCGTGVHAIRIARAGYEVHAIDISRAALVIAERLANEASTLNRVRFQHASITELPFETGAYNTIFSWGVISHIPDVDAALAELLRVLRPGGRIALQVTNVECLDHRVELLARAILRRPISGMFRSQWGVGWWGEYRDAQAAAAPNGSTGELWTWRLNVAAITSWMKRNGCELLHHGASELTEFQRRLPRWARPITRTLNRAYFTLNLPARLACTNLLVFEKRPKT